VKGEVKISGSKNASLAIIAAALVTSNKAILKNVPSILDINNLNIILNKIGVATSLKNNKLKIDNKIINKPLLFDEIKEFRASYYLMSVFLSLFNEVSIYVPGGCNIGARPIDYHLEGFKEAGCDVCFEKDIVHVRTKELKPFTYTLPKKSVGATVNLIILASKIEGKSIIKNASTEPEIDDLIKFINKGNAQVFRNGNNIVIHGSKPFNKKIKYEVMFDRIEAFTFMCIGVNSKRLKIKKINPKDLKTQISILANANMKYKLKNTSIIIYKSKLSPVAVKSGHYPELSTDQMPMLYPIFSRVEGDSIFTEEIFENRFSVCEELRKNGADISIDKNKITIKGKDKFTSGEFYSKDLRGAASLLIEGILNPNSDIYNLKYLERGYENIYKKLKKIGVKFEIEN